MISRKAGRDMNPYFGEQEARELGLELFLTIEILKRAGTLTWRNGDVYDFLPGLGVRWNDPALHHQPTSAKSFHLLL